MRYIAYYRVSTDRQGESGLGLEAQKDTVASYISGNEGDLIAEYVEIESGRVALRPELWKALNHVKLINGTLIVAKLDRLSRNVAFTSALLDSGVNFVCCDNPHANRLMIHILVAMAEYEAEQIRQRTKAGLAAAKRRGTLLGANRPGHSFGVGNPLKGSRIAAENRRKAAKDSYAFLVPVIQSMADGGYKLEAIANHLNASGLTTRRGARFRRSTINKILKREAHYARRNADAAKCSV